MFCPTAQGLRMALVAGLSIALLALAGANPVLTPGVWKNITPPTDISSTYGVTVVDVDPSHPSTIYCSIDQRGLWRSTDGGSTWAIVGDPSYQYNYNNQTKYIDSPIEIHVDPDNSQHLVLTQGVRGATLGFWVSTDGGNNWAWPQGFVNIVKTTTNDVTNMAVDPTDFNHILLSSHSPWAQGTTGIMETTDGGATFIAHNGSGGWNGSLGVNFLYSPKQGIGNSQTWLVSTDGSGFFRTTNSGGSFTQVSTLSAVHGGNGPLYYSKSGVVYAGGNQQMVRSTDNGLTWTSIGPKFADGWYQIIGDGNFLYACVSNTGVNTSGLQPYETSADNDGINWSAYQGGTQKFNDGPYRMKFDSVNRIIYSANWRTGLWALRVIDQPGSTVATMAVASVHHQVSPRSAAWVSRTGVAVRTAAGVVCDVRGRVSAKTEAL